MKTRFCLFIITFLVMFTFGQNTFAQTQGAPFLNLPEDAKVRLGKGSIRDIAYSPDGQLLAVASSIGIWLYDTATYQEVNLLTGQDLTWAYGSVAFSPNGKTIATGGWDGTILWDVTTGENLHTFTGHSGGVSSVKFSPDGTTLASGNNNNGTVLLWDVTPYAPEEPEEPVYLTSDVNQDGQVNILDLVSVGLYFGESASASLLADVNGDGVINILDLVLVAQDFGK